MNDWIDAMQWTALSLSLLWFVLAWVGGPKTPLRIVWAMFCGSIAMMMARNLVGPDAGFWHWMFGFGACFTCNGFWLVARALFRAGPAFTAPHLSYVALIAVLIITTQQASVASSSFMVVCNELLELLSSAGLVMAFWEGLRGWHRQIAVERRLRSVFLLSYGACVMATMIVPAVLGPAHQGASLWINAAAAATILLVTQGLVAWRLRNPLYFETHAPTQAVSESKPEASHGAEKPKRAAAQEAVISVEDVELARTLEHYMRSERPYLRTELKLSHLAQALDIGEYRISRVVHGPLGQRNVSHYINHYRLDHARALLVDPAAKHWSTLVIAMESGFGSLGAFHRAFKAAESCTPGEYRAARGSGTVNPIQVQVHTR
jgi:AraC-like DNA-binding protein